MGGSTTSTTTQRNDPYAAAQPLLDQGLADAQAMYNAGGFNITPWQGDLVADQDALQTQAYNMAGGVAGGALAGAGASQMSLMNAMNPNYQSAAFDQVRQNAINAITPQINSSFAGSGMTGSSLHAQNLAQGLTQGIAGVENEAFQAAQNRSLQAAGMMGQVNQDAYGAIDFMSQMGAQQQAQQQAEIQGQVLQDQQAQTGELQALQDYLSLASGAGSMFGTSMGSTTATQNPGLLGMMGFGLQAAPLLFSDRRLKENIRRVGSTDSGLGVYTYTYKGSDRVEMGVMAQEVEEIRPEAVRDVNGYKAVNYDLI